MFDYELQFFLSYQMTIDKDLGWQDFDGLNINFSVLERVNYESQSWDKSAYIF